MKRREFILLAICILVGYAVLTGYNNKKAVETGRNEPIENMYEVINTSIAIVNTTNEESLPTETAEIPTESTTTGEIASCDEDTGTTVETTDSYKSEDKEESNDNDSQPSSSETEAGISGEIFD